jgi:hypothetical protein
MDGIFHSLQATTQDNSKRAEPDDKEIHGGKQMRIYHKDGEYWVCDTCGFKGINKMTTQNHCKSHRAKP